MRATEHFGLKNVGPGDYDVQPDGAGSPYLNGGLYQLSFVATWGGGDAILQQLGPDGSTWLSVSGDHTANGGETIYLPPGRYRIVVTTATALFAGLTRIPFE